MDKNEDLISIIIPVYNVKPYINQCLDSVLSQTYHNIQVIIVDDGSDDGSAEICDWYAQKDARVEVIHTLNGGSVIARKRGISRAQGKYIGFVDADDYVDADMYAALVNALREYDADFVHSGYIEIRGSTLINFSSFPNKVFLFKEEEDRVSFLKKFLLDIRGGTSLSYSIWSKLFKHELIEKCYGDLNDKQQLGEDGLCFLRCIMESSTVYLMPQSFYYYRNRQNSLSHGDNYIFAQKQVMLCGEFLNTFRQYGIEKKMKQDIYNFMQSLVLPCLKISDDLNNKIINQFYLPDIAFLLGKKVIIYGAGNVGTDLYCQINTIRNVDIVCLVDKSAANDVFKGRKIIRPYEIVNMQYDIILLAVLDKEVVQDICCELRDIGVDENRIIWKKPCKYF